MSTVPQNKPTVQDSFAEKLAFHQKLQAISNRVHAAKSGADFKHGTFLRLSDVCTTLAVSHSTIYKRIAEGTFPPSIKISERSVRWRSEDIEAWRTAIESKVGTP